MAAAAAARHPAAAAAPADAYNNFYYQGYSPFSTGDIRDSIAAIWSRTREGSQRLTSFSFTTTS